MGVNCEDRIILNGGEPLLHTEFKDILTAVSSYGCEVLIYTNGRLLSNIESSMLNSHLRFVIPVHGYKELHDNITRVPGSYLETMDGISYLANSDALVDVKVIINNQMAVNRDDFIRTLDSLSQLPELNAIHITKMADTVVSQQNKCQSVTSEMASRNTKELFEFFKNKCVVKIFDTCIREIAVNNSLYVDEFGEELKVFFKDAQYEFNVDLEKPYLSCMSECRYKNICQSAVGEYTVLEIKNGRFSVGLE